MKPHETLIIRCYRKGLYFSKSKAIALLGSRQKLERLVAEGTIRMEKPANVQNGK